jgi:nifR3 family TIM-barrel protein
MTNLGFWKNLKRPILALAPMANVTDAVFRRIIAKYGKPDVMWTEFVSADGLFLANEEGKRKLMLDLMFSESERPIVAQFFTAKPELMKRAAELARELGFDGVDINMGCPDKSIERQGAGASLIKNPELARELIAAAKDGAGSLPVSVKTRIGYNKNQIEEWIPELLKEKPAVITVHARTRKEMSKVPARWDEVKRAVEIRNDMKSETLILGNGDVADLDDARKRAEETGADGVMLGRAIFGNPWLFANRGLTSDSFRASNVEDFGPGNLKISISEKLNVLVEHTKLFEELLGKDKNFAIMKKHFKAYVNGWDGAKELRTKLMETEKMAQVEQVVASYIDKI